LWASSLENRHFSLFNPKTDGAGTSGNRLFDRTKGETEKLLAGLANGDKLKVRGVNDTNEGPFSPEVAVTGV
jgi:hypothetical protein